MSKIGRKPINVQNIDITVDGQEVRFKGKLGQDVYVFPVGISAELSEDKKQIKVICPNPTKDLNVLWGLHRALFANKLTGIDVGFEKNIVIAGLGFKGVVTGSTVIFSLGYSHKINFEIPKGIAIEIDKTGQMVKIKGSDRELVGEVAGKIKRLRPTEPYKGTGIKLAEEVILRKAGKTKSA